jgi:tRNA nucleotidyltransferase (CCA-adding enzyme)
MTKGSTKMSKDSTQHGNVDNCKLIASICSTVLAGITPDRSIISSADRMVKTINTKLKAKSIGASAMLGGSMAKGTFLKSDHDVDIFVRFNYDYKDHDISTILEGILPNDAERIHGSRDYFQYRFADLDFEIVPVLAVTDYKKAVNVTDMSPLHVGWVKKRTAKNPELLNEIMLLKQFCKASAVYGAESYINGFSGHVIDILVIYYGSFLKTLIATTTWKSTTIIDPEKHLKDPLMDLNKSKLQSPLIVVDPIQKDRNAAAAISKEKYGLFMQKAREFLEHPSAEKFNKIVITKTQLIQRKEQCKNWFIFLEIDPVEQKKDVAGTKVLHIYLYLKKNLANHEFKIIDADWFFSTPSLIWFEVQKEKLSESVEWEGPPVKAKNYYNAFIKKHQGTYIKNNRVYAKLKREYLVPKRLIDVLMRTTYVRDRCKSIHMTG